MYREILFRGKRVDNNEWVEGFYSQFHNIPVVPEPNSHQIFELLDDEHSIRFARTAIGGIWHIIDENTLGQFTGKYDKNKNKIFEGDIVEGNFPYANRGLIVFDQKRAGFYIKPLTIMARAAYDPYYKMNSARVEILGNIYDNPELLEGISNV